MKIIGLKSGMVMQRGIDNTADVYFKSDRKVEKALNIGNNSCDPVDAWLSEMSKKDGVYTYNLTGIPAGGPYTLVLITGEEEIRFTDMYTGDVWLLAGQSNMEGVGLMTEDDLAYTRYPDPWVRALYMTDEWGPATALLHQTWKAVDRVHTEVLGAKPENFNPLQLADRMGVGPGLSFGRSMKEWLGVPQGLICCAHGGTSLVQWDPDGRDEGGDKSLYGAMYRRFVNNGAHVRGLFWYQGCSETNQDGIENFDARMIRFVEHIRSDFGNIPIVQVQIGRLISYYSTPEEAARVDREWSAIRERQRLLGNKISLLDTVATIPFTIEDGIHLTSEAQSIVGRNAAEAMACLLQKQAQNGRNGLTGDKFYAQPLGGIQVEEVTAAPHILGHFISELTAAFSNIHDSLHATPEPRGFLIFQDDKPLDSAVVNARINANKVILSVNIPPDCIEQGKFSLAYGYGRNPCCNLTDGNGYAIPAFGPLPVKCQ